MNSVTDLNKLLKQTPFVIVGGVATRLYMVERKTLDLDILVLSSGAANAGQELEQSGALPLGRLFQVGTLTCGGSSWQLPDGTKLDIIESSQTWATHAISHRNYSPNGLPVIDLPYKRVDEVRND